MPSNPTKSPLPGWRNSRNWPSFRTLQLSGEKITDAGLQHLKWTPRLEWLDLRKANISDAGLEHLKGLTQLKDLDLEETNVTGVGLEHLKGLPHLKTLVLGGEITNVGLEHLKGLTHLQDLTLGGRNVSNVAATDAGLEQLKDLPQLRALELHASRFTDASLSHLKGLAQIEQLNLMDTAVSGEGLEQLKDLSQLRTLSFSGKLSDAGLQHLKVVTRLKGLYLWQTQVTAAGIRDLSAALPSCHIELGSGPARPSAPASGTGRPKEAGGSDDSAIEEGAEGTAAAAIRIEKTPGQQWSALLPGGTGVWLEDVGGDGRWWRPDGTPTEKSPNGEFEESGVQSSHEKGVRRTFFVTVLTALAEPCGLKYEVTPGSELAGPSTFGLRDSAFGDSAGLCGLGAGNGAYGHGARRHQHRSVGGRSRRQSTTRLAKSRVHRAAELAISAAKSKPTTLASRVSSS